MFYVESDPHALERVDHVDQSVLNLQTDDTHKPMNGGRGYTRVRSFLKKAYPRVSQRITTLILLQLTVYVV